VLLFFLAGCSTPRPDDPRYVQIGESVVLISQEPARLAFSPEPPWPIVVRSTYLSGLPQTIVYQQGRDFVADEFGHLWRTPDSRIPDFSTNILFGKEDFDHSKFPGFGNGAFFAYVDYTHRGKFQPKPAKPEFGAAMLPKTQAKLRAGESLRLVAFGDSITAGGDASAPKLIFWERWATALRQKYPRATITAINGATGGDSTVQGLARLTEKVIAQKPDLVLIGFGMNDHNISGVPVPAFSDNLRKLVDRVRAESGAEVVLFSTFPPNPKWHYGSHNMAAYAKATEAVAREKHCAFADVFGLWQKLNKRKKPEDVLGNNINHPNDYGHWIYLQAFQTLGL
jgi:lysophospholipase L1-like esterase